MATWRTLLRGVRDEDTGEVVTRSSSRWLEYQAFLAAGGVVLPMIVTPPPLPTLAEARDRVVDAIEDQAARLRTRALRGMSPAELAIAIEKLRQARAVQASGVAADAPMLAAEAAKRGITLAALITKVLQKAQAWMDYEAQVAGASGKHADAVRALGTVAAVLAYDWRSTEWP